jgi:hypothetical protein
MTAAAIVRRTIGCGTLATARTIASATSGINGWKYRARSCCAAASSSTTSIANTAAIARSTRRTTNEDERAINTATSAIAAIGMPGPSASSQMA